MSIQLSCININLTNVKNFRNFRENFGRNSQTVLINFNLPLRRVKENSARKELTTLRIQSGMVGMIKSVTQDDQILTTTQHSASLERNWRGNAPFTARQINR